MSFGVHDVGLWVDVGFSADDVEFVLASGPKSSGSRPLVRHPSGDAAFLLGNLRPSMKLRLIMAELSRNSKTGCSNNGTPKDEGVLHWAHFLLSTADAGGFGNSQSTRYARGREGVSMRYSGLEAVVANRVHSGS